MNLRALILCDDLRLEASGQITAVGIYGDRIPAPPGEGPIVLPRLAILAIVGGLLGVVRVGYRVRVGPEDTVFRPQGAWSEDRHQPELDQHNFLFIEGPVGFEAPGRYEVALELREGEYTLRARTGFEVVR